ncbi:MAG: hypothetical protein CVU22_00315 [Betaproteobacteria bacterium HGW-Betaproteobacteria-16]|nr:MAG: hypothetical protein CVU22_00315 [Betaproteobacteria bacterium HGW-Betaproteobacteria-16]
MFSQALKILLRAVKHKAARIKPASIMIINSNPTLKTNNLISHLVLLLTIGVTFYGFFDRYPIFHDEIINTYKAQTADIFNYALRPTFYFINYLSYHHFGNRVESLTFAAALAFILTVLLVYKILLDWNAQVAGLISVVMLLFSPYVTNLAIRGMAHIYVGLFSVIFLYLVSVALKAQKRKARTLLLLSAGCSANMMLGSHPTALGFFVAIVAWGVGGATLKHKTRDRIYPTEFERRDYWILLSSTILFFSALNILFHTFYGKTYFEQFINLNLKITSQEFDHYFQPWYWYLNYFFSKSWPFLGALSIAVCAWLIAKSRRKYSDSENDDTFVKFCALVWLLILTETAALSLATWKFDRVLVGFIPVISIGIAMLIDYFAIRGIQGFRLLVWSTLGAAVSFTVYSGIVDNLYFTSKVRENSHLAHSRYLGLLDVLKIAPTKNIGYVGDNAGIISRYITLANKNMISFGSANEIKSTPDATKTLFYGILQNNTKFIVIQRARPDQLSKTTSNGDKELASIIREQGAQLIYSTRHFDVWAYDPVWIEPELGKFAQSLSRKDRIGILASESEINSPQWESSFEIFRPSGARPYAIPTTGTPEGNLELINRYQVKHILISDTTSEKLDEEALNKFIHSLLSNGFQLKFKSDALKLDVYEKI